MIAPIRETETRPRSARLRHAHRVVASTLLGKPRHVDENAPPVARWKAWVFTVWVVVVTAVYAGYMLRVW